MSSSGVALLDPVFSGGGVERIAIASGKNGTVGCLGFSDNESKTLMGCIRLSLWMQITLVASRMVCSFQKYPKSFRR